MQDFIELFTNATREEMISALIMFTAGYLTCMWNRWATLKAKRKAEQAAEAARTEANKVQA